MYIFDHLSSLLWSTYLELELLGHVVIMFNSLRNKLFLKQFIHLTFPKAMYKGSFSLSYLYSGQITCYFLFQIVAILVGVKLYLIVISISISLITEALSVFSRAYWPFVYLCYNIYSYPLPTVLVPRAAATNKIPQAGWQTEICGLNVLERSQNQGVDRDMFPLKSLEGSFLVSF